MLKLHEQFLLPLVDGDRLLRHPSLPPVARLVPPLPGPDRYLEVADGATHFLRAGLLPAARNSLRLIVAPARLSLA